MAAHCGQGNAILPIRFFKIILKTNLERAPTDNWLPLNFRPRSATAWRYGSGLSNPVFLKPPDGTEWKVYWTKKNGEFWFQKGWKEFTENYSLDHGYLVVFTYGGTSQFDVLILDHHDLEIDYPSCDSSEENENLDQSDDDSVKILDELEDHKAKQKPPKPLFSSRPHKKMRGKKDTQGSLSLNWPKEPRAQEVAKKFISESNNPFFTKYLKPVHVAEGQLTIPNLDGYIENKKKDVILQLGKRLWQVKLLGSHNSSCCRFSAGWSLFASENKLQPGDVCIFELVNREDIVFEVHIFKSHN